jgi:hypothetical protein
MDLLISVIWLGLLAGVAGILSFPASRELFIIATKAHPLIMGMLKFALLGTMGELLGTKVITGRWRLKGIRLHQRIIVWAFLGLVFAIILPLFSYGIDGLLGNGMIPGRNIRLLEAFWKSFFMQLIFAFPFMVFHRITDTLIEKNRLFAKWPVIETFVNIDWKNMFTVVGWSIIWFWLPVQTINYLLPPEFRVVVAALLAVALGFILGLAKRLSVKQAVSVDSAAATSAA